jgi:hypothetical protein
MRLVRKIIKPSAMHRVLVYWTPRGYVKKVLPISQIELIRRGLK